MSRRRSTVKFKIAFQLPPQDRGTIPDPGKHFFTEDDKKKRHPLPGFGCPLLCQEGNVYVEKHGELISYHGSIWSGYVSAVGEGLSPPGDAPNYERAPEGDYIQALFWHLRSGGCPIVTILRLGSRDQATLRHLNESWELLFVSDTSRPGARSRVQTLEVPVGS